MDPGGQEEGARTRTEGRDELGRGSMISTEDKREEQWQHRRSRRAEERGQSTDSDNGGQEGGSSKMTMQERPAWAGALQRTMEGGDSWTHTEHYGQGAVNRTMAGRPA
mgnify:CR=1 FL=1